MTDPWKISEIEQINENIQTIVENKVELEFEDNFSTSNFGDCRLPVISGLPDSQSYLESLEKKLSKLKNNQSFVEQLSNKREECLRNLLNESISLDKNDAIIDLDAAIVNGDSTVHDIYRHLYPIQPLSVGETIHIVKHDQLAKSEEDSTSDSESASR